MATFPAPLNPGPATPPPMLPPASSVDGVQLGANPFLPVPPVAEAGSTTTEWKATIGAGVAATLGLLVAFGVHLSPDQIGAVEVWFASVSGLVATYTLSRGIRKARTTA